MNEWQRICDRGLDLQLIGTAQAEALDHHHRLRAQSIGDLVQVAKRIGLDYQHVGWRCHDPTARTQ
jgi:hypothetical protein